MDTNKMRDDFEAYYAEEFSKALGYKKSPEEIKSMREGDGYGCAHGYLNGFWHGWKASRKEFFVISPKADDFPMLDHFDYSRKCGFKEGLEFAMRSIGCQGVRIKP